MSDPSSGISGLWRMGSHSRNSSIKKSRSETENVDSIGVNGCAEVEAYDIKNGMYI